MAQRPLTQQGYWPHTANINFCEPDYEVTHYVAEFWNAASSIPMILTGVFGILLARQQKLGAEQALSYFGVGIVGCGSLAFHGTLMRTGQVLDEIPMLWGVLMLLYCAYQHAVERRRRLEGGASANAPTPTRLLVLRGVLLFYALSATGVYFSFGFDIFILLYGVSVACLVLGAFYAIFTATPPTGAEPRRLMRAAALSYVGGVVAFWLPSELLCDSVPLLQRLPLHAIFHLTSAAGPHLGLTAFAFARFEHERPKAPPSLWFAGLPAIDRGAALHKQV